jgi:predicted amidohydrolase/ribosomal protein S18 acetylase RimI-like enzyme
METDAYETPIEVRQLVPADYEQVVQMQQICFPRMEPWTRKEFESQLTIFPEGQIGVEIEGRLVASSSSLLVDQNDYANWHDWLGISGEGAIQNHDPDGNALYGIEMQVDPEFRGMKLSRRMYDARKELCRQRNLACIVFGGRIPGYAKHKDSMSPRAYVEAVQAKRVYDPVLTSQLSNGFVLRRLIPDYMPSDEDSAGYATHLEWANLDYIPPRSHRQRRAVRMIQVAAVQYQLRRLDSFEEFATHCEFFVDTAADYQADFLLFPELFTLQLLSLVTPKRPGQSARQLAAYTPRYLELFNDLAVRYNVNIIGGTQFTLEDDRLHNTAFLFRRDGTIASQHKIHITPSEASWWGVQGGDEAKVFETDRGRIAIPICYDVQFPELVRFMVDRGAELLFVPYNTNDRHGHLRVQLCAQARCVENHIYTVTAGCVGNLPWVENDDVHYAQSGVYTPSDVSFARDGIAAEASPNIETVLVHGLDAEALRRHRREGTVQNWNDRRTDLYRVEWKGQG